MGHCICILLTSYIRYTSAALISLIVRLIRMLHFRINSMFASLHSALFKSINTFRMVLKSCGCKAELLIISSTFSLYFCDISCVTNACMWCRHTVKYFISSAVVQLSESNLPHFQIQISRAICIYTYFL